VKLENRKLSELTEYENNSRTHSPQQIEQIARSMEEFGWTNPILIDEQGGIIAGHGRKLAAEIRGEEFAPCIVLSGLTDEQKRAYLIADNQLPLNAGWDLDKLKAEILDLDFDLDVLGFDAGFLDDLLSDVLPAEDPKVLAESEGLSGVTVPGDIWQLGEHRVMCGDSVCITDVEALAGGERAALLHADPPYGMGKQKDGVANDNLYGQKLDEFQLEWWQTWRPFLLDNASAYIWGTAPDLWRLWYSAGLSKTETLELRNEIVWKKPQAQGIKNASFTQYAEGSERCIFFQVGDQYLGSVNSDKYWSGWDPLLSYLKGQADAAGLTSRRCLSLTGTHMHKHWFTKSQWSFIHRDHYELLAKVCPGFFLRPWSELKAEYDKIRQGYRKYVGEYRTYFDNSHSCMTDVWDFPLVFGDDRHGHATPKPVEMMERVMRTSLPRGGLCLEPFGGSGSTLIAAEKTGRRCYTMELKPEYVDVIVRRWQKLTGGVATHASTGADFASESTS
jgi:DNA modification methylase